jgi:hypothetical protein
MEPTTLAVLNLLINRMCEKHLPESGSTAAPPFTVSFIFLDLLPPETNCTFYSTTGSTILAIKACFSTKNTGYLPTSTDKQSAETNVELHLIINIMYVK